MSHADEEEGSDMLGSWMLGKVTTELDDGHSAIWSTSGRLLLACSLPFSSFSCFADKSLSTSSSRSRRTCSIFSPFGSCMSLPRWWVLTTGWPFVFLTVVACTCPPRWSPEASGWAARCSESWIAPCNTWGTGNPSHLVVIDLQEKNLDKEPDDKKEQGNAGGC